MKNPIPRSKLFATPATEEDLYHRIEQLVGSDKALAYQIAMMTFNLCNHLVDREIACRELIDPLDA
jgi:hypothetical protein